MDFNSWVATLRDALQVDNNSLSLNNGHWEVEDRKSLLYSLRTRIFDSHLNQIKECAVEVLSEIDPQFELPTEERYAAKIHGKVLKYSSDLRQGLAETLAILGTHGNILQNCSPHKSETIAILSLREIFKHADWQLWGSLNDLLPALSEASPSEFLNTVEHALRQTPCPFDKLFAQEGNGISGRNYMTGLLWSLEGLAWSEEYLVRVALILAELASRDPGGKWANRPANSLTTILLPWFPQTLASIDKRIAAMKAIKSDFPDIAWKVLISLLPNQHQTSSGAHKPRWRSIVPEDWKPEVSNKDYSDQVVGYAELAVHMACEDLDKLKEIVGNLDNLPPTSFDAILDYLSSESIIELPENERLPIWTKLTDFASKHRRFAETEWALAADIVTKIEVTANKLSPTSLEGLHRRLFSNRDFDLYEERGNWEEQRKKLDGKRKQAIHEIFAAQGLQGVITFIDSVESPNQVGWALGQIATNDVDTNLLPDYLAIESVSYQQFASSFVWSRYHLHGWNWVDNLNRSNWSLSQNCQFLMYLPFVPDTWRHATEWLGNSENLYWEKVNVNPYQSDSDISQAIGKLLEVKRPQASIDCLYYRLHEKMPLNNKQVVLALLSAVSTDEPVNTMDPHQIVDLIKALQNDPETDKDDLFNVEWAYLRLLDRFQDAAPKLLETRLATQPEFFCEAIRLVYRSKFEEKKDEEPDEQREAIASNAWRLLHEWRRPPGLQEDGGFSAKEFESWLNIVKEQCTESGHLEVAMNTIGEVLLYCPPDPQGLWIVEPAARALNARDAEDMRNGFRTEVYNSRGAHWVDPTGKPERELATHWREKADAVENASFGRFAATLRELATSYDREAERISEELKTRIK
ncbi:hypothetical protein [Trichlorobacter lovleyi]|uniref:hypothetical protein n=1 Tax=Trichlorobacter lovleyi TaxID=313985 RepID=UPI0024807DC7|nr:hypothetical protein [Trichlorobacter lovleyi]